MAIYIKLNPEYVGQLEELARREHRTVQGQATVIVERQLDSIESVKSMRARLDQVVSKEVFGPQHIPVGALPGEVTRHDMDEQEPPA